MKKMKLLVALFALSNICFGQTKIDSLVQKGIKYHDNGQYAEAISVYKEALEIEPNSALVNYEIAMTLMYDKKYKESIKHCDKVIDLNDKLLIQAYNTKGSCLDNLGKTKKSIKVFEEAIEKFGDNYLIYYNLGFNYYKEKDYFKAEEAFINAISNNSEHASSHLLLGIIKSEQNQKVQSLLCLYYFLFLESDSERSKTAYNLLMRQLKGNVQKDNNEPNQINITLDSNQMETEFAPASIMISMLEASKSLEENANKSEEELFIENNTDFFKVLGELRKDQNEGLWWNFYVPFFYELANTEHIETYSYYISYCANDNSLNWLKKNPEKIEQFNQWLTK